MNNRLEQLQSFLAENPDDVFLHYALASEYQKMGDQEQALQKFKQLTEQYPDYLGTYYQLGKLYEALGQTQEALSTYEKGMDVARKARNTHTLGELQGAWNLLNAEENEDW